MLDLNNNTDVATASNSKFILDSSQHQFQTPLSLESQYTTALLPSVSLQKQRETKLLKRDKAKAYQKINRLKILLMKANQSFEQNRKRAEKNSRKIVDRHLDNNKTPRNTTNVLLTRTNVTKLVRK